MDVLFLSCLCSDKKYHEILECEGTVLSHSGQKFNYMLAKGLTENGCNVTSLSFLSFKGRKIDDENENGIDFLYIEPRYKGILKRIHLIRQTKKIVSKWLKKNKEGIIICDVLTAEFSFALATLFDINKKTIGLVTDVPTIRAGDSRKGIKAIPKIIKSRLITIYDSYIFLTKAMNDKLNPYRKPYVIIEGMVTGKEISYATKSNEMKCVMAGLLEDIYGVETLINSFEMIEDRNARLLFYGKGSSVQKIVSASKKDTRIQYCGEVANDVMQMEERSATLLINPRPAIGEWINYSFPSKNMEYIASGTPLVAFDLPCIPDEYHAYFYPFREYTKESMAEVINTLLQKENGELQSFGQAAQHWIVTNKNAKVQTGKIVEMIKRKLENEYI